MNASSICVYQTTGVGKGWQWSVAGPHGMTFGSASTKEAAWTKARECHAAMEQTASAIRRARGEG